MPQITSEKCVLLAKKIEKILINGLNLSNDVLHYIDSTFSNPSVKELEALINDASDCEKDSLLELIFFRMNLFRFSWKKSWNATIFRSRTTTGL